MNVGARPVRGALQSCFSEKAGWAQPEGRRGTNLARRRMTEAGDSEPGSGGSWDPASPVGSDQDFEPKRW